MAALVQAFFILYSMLLFQKQITPNYHPTIFTVLMIDKSSHFHFAPPPLTSCTQSCDSTSDTHGCLFVLWILLNTLLFAQGGGLEIHEELNNDHFLYQFFSPLNGVGM